MGSLDISGEAATGAFRISDKATTDGGSLTNQVKIKSLVIENEAVVPKWDFDGGEVEETVVLKKLKTDVLLFTGSGTKFPDEIKIENVILNALRFVDFRASTNVMITNVQPSAEEGSSYLEFTRSSFQKLELIGNRFEGFDFLLFENSDLTSTFMAGTDFPRTVRARIETSDKEADTHDRRQAKLFFEQVKTVMLRQGNRTGAIHYQAEELKQHHKLVELWSPKSALDKITLWFNKCSNGFGTNWLRGLSFFFGVTIFLYWLLLINTPSVEAAWPWQMTWPKFNEFAVHYFDFINPTSHIWKRWDYIYFLENGPDAAEEVPLRWGIKLLLLFSKIIIITMIYQIVQAFRKFGRR